MSLTALLYLSLPHSVARTVCNVDSAVGSVTDLLSATLGDEVANLRLRVGLHSGPVTAGVLRGDKGRFQLFGDTVNTASRMESTGRAGRIQVSAATADLLRGGDIGAWLVPREEQVEAKGKGLMYTFWLDSETSNRTANCENHNDSGYSAAEYHDEVVVVIGELKDN